MDGLKEITDLSNIQSMISFLNQEDKTKLAGLLFEINAKTDSAENISASDYLSNTLELMLESTAQFFNADMSALLIRVKDPKKQTLDLDNISSEGSFVRPLSSLLYLRFNPDFEKKEDFKIRKSRLQENAEKSFSSVFSKLEYEFVFEKNLILVQYANFEHYDKTIEDPIKKKLFFNELWMTLLSYFYEKKIGSYNRDLRSYTTFIDAPIQDYNTKKPVFDLTILDFAFDQELSDPFSSSSLRIIEREMPFVEEVIRYRSEQKKLGRALSREDAIKELRENEIISRTTPEERLQVLKDCNIQNPFTDYQMKVFDIYRQIISSVLIKARRMYDLETALTDLKEAQAQLERRRGLLVQ